MDRGSWQATVHRAHRVGHNWRTGPKLTLKWTSSILLMEWSRILEGLMLELKLQCFGYLMRRADTLKRPWFGKRLRAREGGNRGWDGWMASLTQWIWVWANYRREWRTAKPHMLHGVTKSQIWLSNCTTLKTVEARNDPVGWGRGNEVGRHFIPPPTLEGNKKGHYFLWL